MVGKTHNETIRLPSFYQNAFILIIVDIKHVETMNCRKQNKTKQPIMQILERTIFKLNRTKYCLWTSNLDN